MKNRTDWTVMTDRQKGLSNVIGKLHLKTENGLCIRHMYTSFFNKGYKGKTLKNLLWQAAKSTTLADCRHGCNKFVKLVKKLIND